MSAKDVVSDISKYTDKQAQPVDILHTPLNDNTCLQISSRPFSVDRRISFCTTADAQSTLAQGKTKGTNTLVPFPAHVEADLSTYGTVTHIETTCDELDVVVATSSGMLLVFSAADAAASTSAAKSLKPTNTIDLDTEIRDIRANPKEIPNLLAVLTLSGSLIMVDLESSTQTTIADENDQITTAMCWSRKGKQIVCGDSKSVLTQRTPLDGTVKRTIEPQRDDDNIQPDFAVLAIDWVDTYTFFAVYGPLPDGALIPGNGGGGTGADDEDDGVDDNMTAAYVITKAGKTAATQQWLYIEDPCSSMMCPTRYPGFQIACIPQWGDSAQNLLIMVGTGSDATMTVGQALASNDGGALEWAQWDIDGCMAVMPMSALDSNDGCPDSFPLGMAVDYTAKADLPPVSDDGARVAPVPIVWMLTTDGCLLAYHIYNLKEMREGKTCPDMVSEVNKLPVSDAAASPALSSAPSTEFSLVSSRASSPEASVDSLPAASAEPSPAPSAKPSPGPSVESSPTHSVESSPAPSVESSPVLSPIADDSTTTTSKVSSDFGKMAASAFGSQANKTASTFGVSSLQKPFGSSITPATSDGLPAAFAKPVSGEPSTAFGSSTGAFGSSTGAFGSSTSFAPAFGKTSTITPIVKAPASMDFKNKPVFGSSATSGATGFGGFGGFGGASSAQNSGGTSIFDAPSDGPSIFGKPASSVNKSPEKTPEPAMPAAFAKPATKDALPSAFGSSTGFAPAFGGPSNIKPIVKAAATTDFKNKPVFGSSSSTGFGGFGGFGAAQAAEGKSIFDAPSDTPSVFGQQPSAFGSAKPKSPRPTEAPDSKDLAKSADIPKPATSTSNTAASVSFGSALIGNKDKPADGFGNMMSSFGDMFGDASAKKPVAADDSAKDKPASSAKTALPATRNRSSIVTSGSSSGTESHPIKRLDDKDTPLFGTSRAQSPSAAAAEKKAALAEKEKAQKIKEEEKAQKLKEEKEKAQKLKEEKEKAQKQKEEEEKARKRREEEEKARKLREEKEKAQKLKEEQERQRKLKEQKERERVEKMRREMEAQAQDLLNRQYISTCNMFDADLKALAASVKYTDEAIQQVQTASLPPIKIDPAVSALTPSTLDLHELSLDDTESWNSVADVLLEALRVSAEELRASQKLLNRQMSQYVKTETKREEVHRIIQSSTSTPGTPPPNMIAKTGFTPMQRDMFSKLKSSYESVGRRSHDVEQVINAEAEILEAEFRQVTRVMTAPTAESIQRTLHKISQTLSQKNYELDEIASRIDALNLSKPDQQRKTRVRSSPGSGSLRRQHIANTPSGSLAFRSANEGASWARGPIPFGTTSAAAATSTDTTANATRGRGFGLRPDDLLTSGQNSARTPQSPTWPSANTDSASNVASPTGNTGNQELFSDSQENSMLFPHTQVRQLVPRSSKPPLRKASLVVDDPVALDTLNQSFAPSEFAQSSNYVRSRRHRTILMDVLTESTRRAPLVSAPRVAAPTSGNVDIPPMPNLERYVETFGKLRINKREPTPVEPDSVEESEISEDEPEVFDEESEISEDELEEFEEESEVSEEEFEEEVGLAKPASPMGFGGGFNIPGFGVPQSGWKCSECYINNPDTLNKCQACENERPGSKPTSQTTQAKPASPMGFGGGFNIPGFGVPQSGWKCSECYINNPDTLNKCQACENERPGSKPAVDPAPQVTKLDFSSGFKPASGLSLGTSSGSSIFGSSSGNKGMSFTSFVPPTGASSIDPLKDKSPSTSSPSATDTVESSKPKPAMTFSGFKPSGGLSLSGLSGGSMSGLSLGSTTDKPFASFSAFVPPTSKQIVQSAQGETPKDATENITGDAAEDAAKDAAEDAADDAAEDVAKDAAEDATEDATGDAVKDDSDSDGSKEPKTDKLTQESFELLSQPESIADLDTFDSQDSN
ncbi:hypothetical protein GGI07_002222 [Coemansia sp. Benny D115]|nr:hypothetical protein GGI07_002222 [Coemansia sp. Benny D115]